MWVISIFLSNSQLVNKRISQNVKTIPVRVSLLFIPLLVMIGPAVMTAFPDAAGGESRLSSPSRLRRRPQICQSHHQILALTEVRGHKLRSWFCTYWYEHDAIVCPAKLGDTVQKHSGHLLVSVFNETENLEGKTSHLTFPILKNGRLRVFVAAVWKEYNTHTHTCYAHPENDRFDV